MYFSNTIKLGLFLKVPLTIYSTRGIIKYLFSLRYHFFLFLSMVHRLLWMFWFNWLLLLYLLPFFSSSLIFLPPLLYALLLFLSLFLLFPFRLLKTTMRNIILFFIFEINLISKNFSYQKYYKCTLFSSSQITIYLWGATSLV